MLILVPEEESKPSPSSSKNKSQSKTWDAKRMLVKKRLEGLAHDITNEESENADYAITHCEAKANTSSSPHSCAGAGSTSAMERALKVQGNLSTQFPNFSKLMMKSHVCGRFRMCLPKSFSHVHVPKHDGTVVLVDDKENEYKMKYLVNRNAISDGWQRFSLAQKLMEGDVIVFQLVQPCKFKVFIVRASGLSELDGDMKTEEQSGTGINEMKKQSHLAPLAVDIQNDKNKEVLISDNEPDGNQRGDNSYNSSSKTVKGIRFSESVVNFKDVKDFRYFKISIDGLHLDSEISTHLRKKYYELCCSQNVFLHENLTRGLNIKLATGIISETVNIADAIRAVKATTSLDDLESWDRTLKAFEDLGMSLGFLRARIHELLTLFVEYQEIIESKRSEKAEAEHEMSCLKEKLLEFETLIRSLNEEIDALKVKSEGLSFAIRDAASAPW